MRSPIPSRSAVQAGMLTLRRSAAPLGGPPAVALGLRGNYFAILIRGLNHDNAVHHDMSMPCMAKT